MIMTTLEIALKLRKQVKEQWPYVSTILALYENNTEGQFTDRIQKMVDKLLPDEVFYTTNAIYWEGNKPKKVTSYNILCNKNKIVDIISDNIESLPINTVLFATEDNPFGILK